MNVTYYKTIVYIIKFVGISTGFSIIYNVLFLIIADIDWGEKELS